MIISKISKPMQEQQAIFVRWIYIDHTDIEVDEQGDSRERYEEMEPYKQLGEKLSKMEFPDIINPMQPFDQDGLTAKSMKKNG